MLRVSEGTGVVLSMLPNGVPVTITTPSGQEFGDNYDLGVVTVGQSGTYVLRTDEGCVSTIELIVQNTTACVEGDIIPEYRIDGVWLEGDDEVTVDEGTDVMLSMLPNNVDVAITTPDGNIVGDDFRLGNVTPNQSGIYILKTNDGCTQTITLNVRDLPNCDAESVIPEYRIDGVWRSGSNFQRMKEGTEIVLSILNDDVGMTITLPNGSTVGNDYVISNYTTANNGIYVLTSSQGCKTTLELYAPPSADSRIDTVASSDFFSPNEGVGAGISVYPNPTVDIVTVDVRGFLTEGFTLIVRNMGQQELMTQEFDANHPDQIEVDLSGFSSGIYFFALKEPDGSVVTLRVVKN